MYVYILLITLSRLAVGLSIKTYATELKSNCLNLRGLEVERVIC